MDFIFEFLGYFFRKDAENQLIVHIYRISYEYACETLNCIYLQHLTFIKKFPNQSYQISSFLLNHSKSQLKESRRPNKNLFFAQYVIKIQQTNGPDANVSIKK